MRLFKSFILSFSSFFKTKKQNLVLVIVIQCSKSEYNFRIMFFFSIEMRPCGHWYWFFFCKNVHKSVLGAEISVRNLNIQEFGLFFLSHRCHWCMFLSKGFLKTLFFIYVQIMWSRINCCHTWICSKLNFFLGSCSTFSCYIHCYSSLSFV